MKMVGSMILNLKKAGRFVRQVRNGIRCILMNVRLDNKLRGIGDEFNS